MADLSDVEQALADATTAILYPGGSSQSSIIGTMCRIYRGWPNAAALNADLNSGVINITISSDNDTGRITTRYLSELDDKVTTSGLSVTTSGTTVSIYGSANVGDVIGAVIDGLAFSYRIVIGDTPPLIAANLCALIRGSRLASVSHTVITIPGSHSILGRVVSDGHAWSEVRRQEKDVRIIFWCPAPEVRDSVTSAVDSGLAQSSFLVASDEAHCRLSYRSTSTYDQSQNALLYRRDLIYCIEYPTVVSVNSPSLLFGAASLNRHVSFG